MCLSAKITAYFSDQGFKPKDIGTAVIVHEILGLTMLAITWTGCYHFPPSKIPVLQKPIQRISTMIPTKITSTVSSNKIFSSKISSAYIESSCLRKLIRPLTIPGKMILTLRIVSEISKQETLNSNYGQSSPLEQVQKIQGGFL